MIEKDINLQQKRLGDFSSISECKTKVKTKEKIRKKSGNKQHYFEKVIFSYMGNITGRPESSSDSQNSPEKGQKRKFEEDAETEKSDILNTPKRLNLKTILLE